MNKKVLVAMSGGVDSSVAAYLLKNSGYNVTGATMCLGIKTCDEKVRCCGPEAINDARKVCHRLDIPHYTLDFSKDLEEKVISKFISEYLKGRTPNPCVDCNRFLKFGVLLEKAIVMGFDFLATGHYARIEEINGKILLRKGKDKAKDQSYFLYPIKKERFKSILFPLAELTKEDVREIARKVDLPVATKPQSQDVCFIQDDYRKFILRRAGNIKPGPIVDLDGNILGEHRGLFFYTVGQREKLGISNSTPLYVVSVDAKRNQVIVGEKKDLQAKGLVASNLNLFVDELPQEIFAKIRYTPRETKCRVSQQGSKAKVIFEEKQEAITPGQSVVFYDNDIVLGGGTIEEVIW